MTGRLAKAAEIGETATVVCLALGIGRLRTRQGVFSSHFASLAGRRGPRRGIVGQQEGAGVRTTVASIAAGVPDVPKDATLGMDAGVGMYFIVDVLFFRMDRLISSHDVWWYG